jgi:hypothetical protein
MIGAISASREAGMYRVILEMRDERGEVIGSTDDTVDAPSADEAEKLAVNAWEDTLPESTFAPLLVTRVQP